MENYSVLMSVYYKETPENLKESIQSLYNQTIRTNDFVLVCDGPLTPELNSVIYEAEKLFGCRVMKTVRLEKNLGLGNALNIGLLNCQNSLVARMDSDDISRPERCEIQLKIFEENPELSLCSGTVEEFSGTKENIIGRRILPETQDEILRFAKRRNPFNHPCVMFRKEAVFEAGSYKDLYRVEDYYLWVRMLMKGMEGYNIPEPLLWMRSGNEMYQRRSGKRYSRSQRALFRYMYLCRFIQRSEYLLSCIICSIVPMLPNGIRKSLYRWFLRN